MWKVCADCSVSLPGAVETSHSSEASTLEDAGFHPQQLIVLDVPKHTLNPLDAMFHVFVSYRVQSDFNLLSVLNSSMLSLCRIANKIPFMDKTVFPDNFEQNDLASEKLLYLFWDKTTLADGVDWRGDSLKSGGFIGALLQSLVFVPVLSNGSVGTMMQKPKNGSKSEEDALDNVLLELSDKDGTGSDGRMMKKKEDSKSEEDRLDNVLLELTLAKFLYEYQKEADQNQQGLPLRPCLRIYPIMYPNLKHSIAKLSWRISRKTNGKAVELLTAAGYTPSQVEMLEEDESTTETNAHPWSVFCIVSFFLKFQGKELSADLLETSLSDKTRGLLLEKEMDGCSASILKIVANCISSSNQMMNHRERTNPLAPEMHHFLDEYFCGHFMPTLNSNGINSIRKLSELETHSMQLLSAQISSSMNSSEVEEFCKLKHLVVQARTRNESHALNQRLDDFFDQEASWSTALSSTCAVDLLMKRPFYLFVMVVGSILFLFVGVYLLLFPTVYSRLFPGSDKVETFASGFTSTAILCLVGAVGLGPICIGFTYLGSPKKGRNAAAYALWLPLLLVRSVGFVADDSNRSSCRYLSLETTQSSVQDCIIVYAVTFGVHELYFLACFLAVVFRQEYYWPCFTLGVCAVMCCNFFIFQYTQSSFFNVLISAIVIFLVFASFLMQKISLRLTLKKIQSDQMKDGQDYNTAYEKYLKKIQSDQMKDGQDYNTAYEKYLTQKNDITNGHFKTLNWSWIYSKPHKSTIPWGDSNSSKAPEQNCNDLERLYTLAELVNLPFHQLVHALCVKQQKQPAGLISSEWKSFLSVANNRDYVVAPEIYVGPIKSIQRAIEKIYRCYRSQPKFLTDLVRCQVVFETLDDMRKLMEELHRAHTKGLLQIERIRNRFEESFEVQKTAGFRDVGIKVRVFFWVEPSDGKVQFCRAQENKGPQSNLLTKVQQSLLCEIQLHLKAIYDVLANDPKKHKNYQSRRNAFSS